MYLRCNLAGLQFFLKCGENVCIPGRIFNKLNYLIINYLIFCDAIVTLLQQSCDGKKLDMGLCTCYVCNMKPEQEKISTLRVYGILITVVAILSMLLVIGIWIWFDKKNGHETQVLIYNIK